jgi:hypothetical protein
MIKTDLRFKITISQPCYQISQWFHKEEEHKCREMTPSLVVSLISQRLGLKELSLSLIKLNQIKTLFQVFCKEST